MQYMTAWGDSLPFTVHVIVGTPCRFVASLKIFVDIQRGDDVERDIGIGGGKGYGATGTGFVAVPLELVG